MICICTGTSHDDLRNRTAPRMSDGEVTTQAENVNDVLHVISHSVKVVLLVKAGSTDPIRADRAPRIVLPDGGVASSSSIAASYVPAGPRQ